MSSSVEGIMDSLLESPCLFSHQWISVDSSLPPSKWVSLYLGLLVQVDTFWMWKLDCMISLGVIHGISQVTPTNMRYIIKPPLWCWILSVTLLGNSRAVFNLCSCCYFHLSCFIFISKEFCLLVWSWFFLFFSSVKSVSPTLDKNTAGLLLG